MPKIKFQIVLSLLRKYHIWFIGEAFVLFQFFLQLSSGVIIGSIMQEMHLNALTGGLISSAFYYVYTTMQIPVGMLFDRYSTRFLLTFNIFLCSLGCLWFAHSHEMGSLILGRIVMGAGASFGFVGLSHLLRQNYPLRQFGFLLGLAETTGFLITVFAISSLGVLIAWWGWRYFIQGAACVGFGITLLFWLYIPKEDKRVATPPPHYKDQLFGILTNPTAWVNGFFVGLCFMMITVFGAMWAIPFIQSKLHCSLKLASLIDAFLFLGAALSCPLFAFLGNIFPRRNPLIVASCLSTAILVLAALYLPTANPFIMGSLFFLIGLSCGAYMYAFSIANELAPANSLSTSTGFTNTLAMITAPLFQPFVGLVFDHYHQIDPHNDLGAYQTALLIIPLGLIIASSLVLWLPEKSQDSGEDTPSHEPIPHETGAHNARVETSAFTNVPPI